MSDTSASPFDDLDGYVALPRVTGLAPAPDGSRLVASIQQLAHDKKSYVTSLWEIDPEGGPARQLTSSEKGESSPAFTPDGDLLFVSARPVPGAKGTDEPAPSLWRLPAGGGEAQLVLHREGGVSRARVAARSGTVLVEADVLAGEAEGDDQRHKARKEAAVEAILWEELPVRFWDHDLGPAYPRLFRVEGSADDRGGSWQTRDLTPEAGSSLRDAEIAVDAAGTLAVSTWQMPGEGGKSYTALVSINLASGERRVVADLSAAEIDCFAPALSADGTLLAYATYFGGGPQVPATCGLRLVDLRSEEDRSLLQNTDLWPEAVVMDPSGKAVYFVADQAGQAPIFRVELVGEEVTRLTSSGSYSSLGITADGTRIYALRMQVDSPPAPVKLDPNAPDQEPASLQAPGAVGTLPGRVEQIQVTAADGTAIHANLFLPNSTQPAPLLLWVHGGPLSSWQGWSWRWNPWLMVAKGWAVLLPNPGLSTGYGQHMVDRAWGSWGPVPFADLMAVTDEVAARPDIDDTRTAAMGGSYGGYMANWIAGHTNRFKTIVTHASLWSLERFVGATDFPAGWAQEWGWPEEQPELYQRNSPDRWLDHISTPMLVIHGDRDYRVPIGEGLTLWTDLVRRGVEAKFLYFPDEGHWVLKPGHAKVWYQTVQAWLDHQVLGREWVRPELL